jgi:plasmid maintenance system antidote protein VapI
MKKSASRPRLTQSRAAQMLGVTREHLNRVLRGHRQSRRLTQAFRQLQEARS